MLGRGDKGTVGPCETVREKCDVKQTKEQTERVDPTLTECPSRTGRKNVGPVDRPVDQATSRVTDHSPTPYTLYLVPVSPPLLRGTSLRTPDS